MGFEDVFFELCYGGFELVEGCTSIEEWGFYEFGSFFQEVYELLLCL